MTPGERKEKLEELEELRERQEQLEADLAKSEVPSWPIDMEFHFHRDKDSNYDIAGEYLGFDDGSQPERIFTYSLLEVSVSAKVYKDGTVIATHFNDIELPEEVNLSK